MNKPRRSLLKDTTVPHRLHRENPTTDSSFDLCQTTVTLIPKALEITWRKYTAKAIIPMDLPLVGSFPQQLCRASTHTVMSATNPPWYFHPFIIAILQNQAASLTAEFTSSHSVWRPLVLVCLLICSAFSIYWFPVYITTIAWPARVLGGMSLGIPLHFFDRLILRTWAFGDGNPGWNAVHVTPCGECFVSISYRQKYCTNFKKFHTHLRLTGMDELSDSDHEVSALQEEKAMTLDLSKRRLLTYWPLS